MEIRVPWHVNDAAFTALSMYKTFRLQEFTLCIGAARRVKGPQVLCMLHCVKEG